MDKKDLHLVCIDLEKTYDKCLERFCGAIKDMYEGVSTSVRTHDGVTEDFLITIGLHQGSSLSHYLFTLILDVLTKHIQELAPRWMLFADDVYILLGESREELNGRLVT